MNNLKPIHYSVLKEFSDAKMIRELTAQKRLNSAGFDLIAHTRAGDRVLVTKRSSNPRHFKTLDGVAIEVENLNFTHFNVVGLGPKPRSLR